MKTGRLFTLLVLLLSGSTLFGQGTANRGWSDTSGLSSSAWAGDREGNKFLIANTGPDSLVIGGQKVKGGILIKYDDSMHVRWVKQMPANTGADVIIADDSGNCIVTVRGYLTFGVYKYTWDGKLVFTRKGYCGGRHLLAMDKVGNIYLSGINTGLDSAKYTFRSDPYGLQNNMTVLGPGGRILRSFTTCHVDESSWGFDINVKGLAVQSDGSIVMAVLYRGGLKIVQDTLGMLNMYSGSPANNYSHLVVLIRYSPWGRVLGVRHIYNLLYEYALGSLVLDGKDNIYFTGFTYTGLKPRDPKTGKDTFVRTTPSVYLKEYIARLEPDLRFRWAVFPIRSKGIDQAPKLVFDSVHDAIHVAAPISAWDTLYWQRGLFPPSNKFGGKQIVLGSYRTADGGENLLQLTPAIQEDFSFWPHPSGDVCLGGRFDHTLQANSIVLVPKRGAKALPSPFFLTFGDGVWVSGKVFHDTDGDGDQGSDEKGIPYAAVKVSPGGGLVYTDENGEYDCTVFPGSHSVAVHNPRHTLSVSPASYTVGVKNYENPQYGSRNFAITYEKVHDLGIAHTCVTARVRPGREARYSVTVENHGGLPSQPRVFLKLDSHYTFVKGSGKNTVQKADTLWWDTDTLQPGELQRFSVELQAKTSMTLGTSLQTVAGLQMRERDTFPEDNTDTGRVEASSSYDPNDKAVFPEYNLPATGGQKLSYTIRFQNTGNDTAFQVVIRDTLDANVDIETLRLEAASHSCRMSLKGRVAVFDFQEILLPDSNINEPLSHGFVRYAVRSKAGIARNATVKNKADIYFDYNVPVTTNTVKSFFPLTAVREEIAPFEAIRQMRVMPNPFNGEAKVALPTGLAFPCRLLLTDALGRVRQEINVLQSGIATLKREGLPAGVYFLTLRDKHGQVQSRGQVVVSM